jgi:hypothetical protein
LANKVDEVLDRIEARRAVGVEAKATPLEFLQAVYCNPDLPLSARLKAAVEAAQYIHPRLSVSGVIESQNLGALLDARLKRLAEMKLLPPKVIEAEPAE